MCPYRLFLHFPCISEDDYFYAIHLSMNQSVGTVRSCSVASSASPPRPEDCIAPPTLHVKERPPRARC